MLAIELNDKERAFCDQYVIDYNQTRAALACGYSETSASGTAADILARPHVQEYINYLKSMQSVRTAITADYVLSSIVEVLERAKGKIETHEVMTLDADGKPVIKPVVKEFKPDPKNALKAAELLGKHLALFTDVVDNRMTFTQMPDVKVGLGGAEPTKALTFDIGGEPNAPKSRS